MLEVSVNCSKLRHAQCRRSTGSREDLSLPGTGMGVRCAVGLKWGGKHEPEIPMKPGAKVHLSLSRSMASIQSFGYSDTEVARPKGTASDRPQVCSLLYPFLYWLFSFGPTVH